MQDFQDRIVRLPSGMLTLNGIELFGELGELLCFYSVRVHVLLLLVAGLGLVLTVASAGGAVLLGCYGPRFPPQQGGANLGRCFPDPRFLMLPAGCSLQARDESVLPDHGSFLARPWSKPVARLPQWLRGRIFPINLRPLSDRRTVLWIAVLLLLWWWSGSLAMAMLPFAVLLVGILVASSFG
jgi:hypothetical protein